MLVIPVSLSPSEVPVILSWKSLSSAAVLDIVVSVFVIVVRLLILLSPSLSEVPVMLLPVVMLVIPVSLSLSDVPVILLPKSLSKTIKEPMRSAAELDIVVSVLVSVVMLVILVPVSLSAVPVMLLWKSLSSAAVLDIVVSVLVRVVILVSERSVVTSLSSVAVYVIVLPVLSVVLQAELV